MSTLFKFPDSIEDLCIACVPVGSRVTCNPPPTDTDQDILCLVNPDEEEGFFMWIEKHGWEFEGDEKYEMDEFTSYRKTVDDDEMNLIITTKPEWFDSFLDATRECKEKNVLTKEGRIAVFDLHMKKKKTIKKNIMKQIAAEQQASAAYNMASLQNQALNMYMTQAPSPNTWWGGTTYHTDDFFSTVGDL